MKLRPFALFLTTAILTPGLAPSASAHTISPGYVTSSGGQAVEDSAGGCVRTNSPSHKIPSACQPPAKPAAPVAAPPPPPPVAEAAPAPAPAPVAPAYVGVEQTLAKHKAVVTSDSEFAFNSAHLRAQAYSTLNAVADYVQRHPATKLRIDGYTDSVGSQRYNLALSKRRAGAVAHYLEKRGVPASALKITGHGKQDPIATNTTAAGRAKNRRVAVRVRQGHDQQSNP